MKLLGPEDTAKALADKAANELALAGKLAAIVEGCPELLTPIASASSSAQAKLEAWATSKGPLPEPVQARLGALAQAPASLDRHIQMIGLFGSFYAGLARDQVEEGWARAHKAFTSPYLAGPTGTGGHAVGTTLRALELLFGLPAGHDVRGACAELCFALEWLLGQQAEASSPLCMLAPLANEVARGRATILEVALVQTMNAYSTYAVGCYSTLYPVGDGDPRKPAPGFDLARLGQAKREIQAALEAAELGRLLLLCFETRDEARRDARCALACETELERQQFRKYALLTPTRYNSFALRRRLDVALRDQARFTSSAIQAIVTDMTRGLEPWLEQVEVLEGA